jgi:hypothetical protein
VPVLGSRLSRSVDRDEEAGSLQPAGLRSPRGVPHLRRGHEHGAVMAVMDASVISALAALIGAAIGGLTSFITGWTTQRTLARAQWLEHDKLRRQELYKDFIEEASKCYIDALQHGQADMPALVGLHAKIGRMRVLSSSEIIASAERIGRKILDTYLEPDKTFHDLREMANSRSIDLFDDFSEACRTESKTLWF